MVQRFLPGVAVAVAVIAIVMSWTTQSKNGKLERQLHDQQAITAALTSLARQQGNLNGVIAKNQTSLTRAVRRLLPMQYRALAGQGP